MSKNESLMIKVAIYEDNESLRETLASIIRATPEFELAGEFGHCLDAIKNTSAFEPNVVLMDIDMPGKNGIEGLKEIKSRFPDINVIINTVFEDDDRIFQAIKNGATGYLLKKNSLASLIQSIRDVHEGGAPMSPYVARRVLDIQHEVNKKNYIQLLSDREKEILELLAKGHSYKMVAAQLYISIDTVRTYIKRIYEKLHVHSITEAVHKVFIK
jgi:DNA-binding NarL/FixJ family response regulator